MVKTIMQANGKLLRGQPKAYRCRFVWLQMQSKHFILNKRNLKCVVAVFLIIIFKNAPASGVATVIGMIKFAD